MTRSGSGSASSCRRSTFRAPGNLAKVVVTVDEMSGGRVEVGVGAGWHVDEHRRHGFPFPEIGERAGMLEETLEIIHGLWDGQDGWSFLGRHYVVEDALFRPKPGSLPGRAGGRPNLIVGGQGTPRSFRIAARYADEFNVSSTSPQVAAQKFARSTTLPGGRARPVNAGPRGDVRDADRAGRRRGPPTRGGPDGDSAAPMTAEAWFATRRPRWILGTPDEAREVARFAEAGVQRMMLQDFLPRDLEMIDLAAEALLGS